MGKLGYHRVGWRKIAWAPAPDKKWNKILYKFGRLKLPPYVCASV